MAGFSGTGSSRIPEARDFSHERRLHVKNNPSLHTYNAYHQVLLNKKGVCIDYANTGHLLATLLGLKCAIVGDTVHACWIVQVDGVPHMAENGGINLTDDWRETSKLGTRQSYNYNFGEYIHYE